MSTLRFKHNPNEKGAKPIVQRIDSKAMHPEPEMARREDVPLGPEGNSSSDQQDTENQASSEIETAAGFVQEGVGPVEASNDQHVAILELKAELMIELKGEILNDLRTEFKETLLAELKEELKAELKAILKEGVKGQ